METKEDNIYDFQEQLEVGDQGEQLIKKFYENRREKGKSVYIVRPAAKWEQQQGADFFVVNNDLGTKYFEASNSSTLPENRSLKRFTCLSSIGS